MQVRPNGILTVAYYYDPAVAVGALRPRRFHRYLRELGYESRVIGALVASNEDSCVVHIPDRIGELWERRVESILAGRDPEPLPFEAQIERLIRKAVLPGQPGWSWSRQVFKYATKAFSDEQLTTVISSYPVFGTHLAALHLAERTGLRWIADFRDPFSSDAAFVAQICQNYFERTVFRKADAIIANTEPVAAMWRARYPWAAHKIHTIWNGYDPEDETRALPTKPNTKRIVHTGHLYAGRNANVLVEGIARLRRRSAPGAHATRRSGSPRRFKRREWFRSRLASASHGVPAGHATVTAWQIRKAASSSRS